MSFLSYSGPLNLTLHLTDQRGDVIDATLGPEGSLPNSIQNLQVDSSGNTNGFVGIWGDLSVTLQTASGGHYVEPPYSMDMSADVTGQTLDQVIREGLGYPTASFGYSFGTSGLHNTLAI